MMQKAGSALMVYRHFCVAVGNPLTHHYDACKSTARKETADI